MRSWNTCLGLLYTVTCGIGCMAAQPPERDAPASRGSIQDQDTPKVPNDSEFGPEDVLTYSGRGTLSFVMGDLVFVPEGIKPERTMGLPVVFPDPVDAHGQRVPGKDGFRAVTGEVTVRFDPWYSTLGVSVRGDQGEMIDRTFDVFHAKLSPDVSYEEYVAAYFKYMETGSIALAEEVAPEVTSTEGDLPAPTLNACNCNTGQCPHQQSCPDNEACRCDCKGKKCLCWCSKSAAE